MSDEQTAPVPEVPPAEVQPASEAEVPQEPANVTDAAEPLTLQDLPIQEEEAGTFSPDVEPSPPAESPLPAETPAPQESPVGSDGGLDVELAALQHRDQFEHTEGQPSNGMNESMLSDDGGAQSPPPQLQSQFFLDTPEPHHERMMAESPPELDDAEEQAVAEAEAEAEAMRNLVALLQDAFAEREQLTLINANLQRKVINFKERDKKKKTDEEVNAENKAAATSDNMKTAYLQLLQETFSVRDKIKSRQSNAQMELERLHARFDVKSAKAAELRDYFRDFKREISRGAIFLRSGQTIPPKRIYTYEQGEEELEQRVEEARTKNLYLRNTLKKLERQIGSKETLADSGLAMIDFEQLKIENQTLNEKIEERNDELHKLRKKTTNTVQVLTHIKEKLQFVQQEAQVLRAKMTDQEQNLQDLRDRLTKAKHARDALRGANSTLKQEQGFIGSDRLVVDYEMRKRTLETLEAREKALIARMSVLQSQIAVGNQVETDPMFAARSARMRMAAATLSAHTNAMSLGASMSGASMHQTGVSMAATGLHRAAHAKHSAAHRAFDATGGLGSRTMLARTGGSIAGPKR